ncbi:retrovirus-related pol polyprotein from transposon TNT 1-94 [Tanacetum coccineum]
MNPRNFTLPCTVGSLKFYAMADLGANINIIPKSMFEHLKLAQLKKTDMLVEMADMTKRSPIGIVENILVKIEKFLFPSDFVVMDMLNTRNETMILGRPFQATIHAEIDVFIKEISLGIRGDRVTFNMNKKSHNFTTPIGEVYTINSTSNNEYTCHTSSDASSRVEKTNDLHNENNYCYQEQGRSRKKLRKLKFDINLPNTHFRKPVKQILKGALKFWLTCDPNIRECNGGPKIYEMDEEGVIKKWFEEWCNNNPNTPTLRFTTVQENLNPRPKDYPFKDWLLKSFDDYKGMFDLEVDQLADEYELGIGKKGHMLEIYRKIARKYKGTIPIDGMIKNLKRRKDENLEST